MHRKPFFAFNFALAITAFIASFSIILVSNNTPVHAEEDINAATVDDNFGDSTAVPTSLDPETESTETPDSTAALADSTKIIQCTGSEFHSYCSNDYNCYKNDAGEQVCEYIPFSTESYHCDAADESGQSTCEEIDLAENTTNNLAENGTSGEGTVLCADSDEPGCEETSSELWPLILSLSALAICIVFVIVINLANRKKS